MQGGRAVRLQDIAERVGLSRTAVSNAITGRGRVSPERREEIRRVAREMGYQPNAVARHLRGARTGMIALHLPPATTTLAYYVEATFGIVDAASERGLLVTLLPSATSPSTLLHLAADGVILLDAIAGDPVSTALLSGRVPVVTGEPSPPGLRGAAGVVTSDHAGAMDELLGHLERNGARRPALIVPDVRMSWRLAVSNAFGSWCRAKGLEPRVVTLPHPAPAELLQRTAVELVTADPACDAVVAMSDGAALSVLTGIEQAGLRAGGDVLVAACVDSEPLTYVHPSVTAIDLNPREFGRQCLLLIDRLIQGEQTPARTLVPISLRLRDSTRGR